jgi:hypothetical protein
MPRLREAVADLRLWHRFGQADGLNQSDVKRRLSPEAGELQIYKHVIKVDAAAFTERL